MKRKIAAIFAADIAGYSRLVAEDEEETLRRLASYRPGHRRFHRQMRRPHLQYRRRRRAGRISSAVEAVRCAIDIQESLRTRNMAYPPSRQMSFRIGITIGDVVERDGDLLGDGVNIAARLEGLAEVGGICVSRAVHEQVANKLSVQFADIGAQEVKNIPTPVHAYMVAMRREDGTYATPQVKKPAAAQAAATPNWMWPLAVTVVVSWPSASAAFCILPSWRLPNAPQGSNVASPPPPAAAPAPSPPPARSQPRRPRRHHLVRAAQPPIASGEKFAADDRAVCRRSRPDRSGERICACRPTTRPSPSTMRGVNGFVAAQPTKKPRRARPSSNARSTPTRCSRRANASSMPSATRWFIRMAGRRCRQLPWIERDP